MPDRIAQLERERDELAAKCARIIDACVRWSSGSVGIMHVVAAVEATAEENREWLARRYAQKKREGAAEELERLASSCDLAVQANIGNIFYALRKRAAELRSQTTTTNLAAAESELTGEPHA